MSEGKEKLRLKIAALPMKPGVYLFKNKEQETIYVGKTKLLKKRIASYFQKKHITPKKMQLQKEISDIETIITSTESEALVLENNLIKIHKPKYNILLKDDKTFPFLKITTEEKFPRVLIVRKRKEDGNTYLGPYTNTTILKNAIKQALGIFPIASCKKEVYKRNNKRACLLYQVERCTAPCVEKITQQEYQKMVKQFIKFFQGKQEKLIKELEKEMKKAAEKMQYEKAAKLRDRKKALERIIQKQRIYAKKPNAEYDIIGIAKKTKEGLVQLLEMRNGRVVAQKKFSLKIPKETTKEEIITAFIKQYYARATYIPQEIIIEKTVPEIKNIETWIKTTAKDEKRRRIKTPETQEEKEFIELAKENAKTKLETKKETQKLEQKRITKGLEEIQKIIGLETKPERIEGYDISTLGGTNTVGVRVVFTKGRKDKKNYRRFKIKSIDQQDDYKAIEEIIRRRFTGTLAKEKEPDLLLIDGGKGQVNVVKETLEEIRRKIKIIGLAKKEEEIYLPEKKDPIKLEKRNEGLKLLQRIRDEAHRFAITYHQKKRTKKMRKTTLEEIPGIGAKKAKKILEKVGTIEKIREIEREELEKIEGISKKLAEKIHTYYKENGF